MLSVCEMPQCINNQKEPDMAQQVPHGKHTLSLISAESAVYSRGALCLEGGRGGPHLSSLHKQEKSHKRRCMTSWDGGEWGGDYGWKRPQRQIVEFSLFVVSMHRVMICDLRSAWLQASVQGKGFYQWAS